MKILASDYDGTLNFGGVTDKQRNAIAKWREAGNLFGLISGREYPSLMEVVAHDRLACDFLIASNGAVIIDPNGRVLKESRCDGKIAASLLEQLFSLGVPWCSVATTSRWMVREKFTEHPDEYTLATLPEIPYFNQISVILPTDEEAERVVTAVRERFSKWVNPLRNGNCIDIVPPGIDKAQGLYRLLSVIGASYEDMIAVGDNTNDAAMIAEFRSYAVANAVPAILELADRITPGVAELIETELGDGAKEDFRYV